MVTSVVLVAIPGLAAGWFYLRNYHLYGDVTGSTHLQRKFGRVGGGTTLELLVDLELFGGVWQDLWGSFRSNLGLGSGQMILGSPRAQLGSRLVIGAGLVAASAVGGVIALVHRRPRSPWGWLAWSVALGWTAICWAGLASFAGLGEGARTRATSSLPSPRWRA